MSALRGEVGRTWRKKEVHLPDRKRYVKYTQTYRSRAIVDFDAGEILVETLDDTDPRGSLKNAVVTTLLTPNDPRAVDRFSDKGITLTSDKEPYLLGLVVDQTGKPVRTPAEADSFADWLLEKRSDTRTVEQEGASKTAHFVKLAMVPNLAHKQAEKYRPVVSRFAEPNQINSLQPPAVYEKLRHSLPYQETRQYLDKVVTFRKEFVTSSEGAR